MNWELYTTIVDAAEFAISKVNEGQSRTLITIWSIDTLPYLTVLDHTNFSLIKKI